MALRKRTWAAIVTLILAVASTVGLYIVITNTDAGRARLVAFTIGKVNGAFGGRGTLQIGQLIDIGAQHIVARDVALLDTAGVPVVRVEHLDARLSFRALFSRAILLRELHVRGVHVDLRKDFSGPWNIAYIVTGDTTPRADTGPGFGDDVRVSLLTLQDGVISTAGPWAPSDQITGTLRDSVIALRKQLHDIVETPFGLIERRRITLDRVVAHDAVFTSFDRTPASMDIDTLRGRISDPPVQLVQASGQVRWTGDSINLALPAVHLPASVGSANGRVWWHEPGPVRYDVAVDARAGLSDLQWIWDVLPETGEGTARVRLRTLDNAEDAEFALRDLDVATDGSRIRGRITVTATPRTLSLSDVDLAFDPLQSTLLRRLSYDAVPPEIRGTIRGRLIAEQGGPLTNLLVDRIDARFDDANVAGAVSTLVAQGRVALGAEPAATNFRVMNARVDLRSAKVLAPTLPPTLDGVVEARGLVASASLTQADLRGMQVTWTDAVGNISVASGNARVAFGGRNQFVDADLVFDPISMRALARIDTTVPMQGTLAGSVRARGPVDSLTWQASLSANATSRIDMSGTARLGSSEWRVFGDGNINAFNVSEWFGRADMPVTALTGTVAVNVRGGRDSSGIGGIREMRGDLRLSQPAARELPGFDLMTAMVLDDRRLHIDSATARLGGIVVTASGALARDTAVTTAMATRDTVNPNAAAVDTITFSVVADSIGSARPDLLRLSRMLQPVDSSAAATVRGFVEDSIDGTAVGSGYLYGSLPSFGATFSFGGRDLRMGNILVNGLFGSALLTGLPGRPRFETAATATGVDGIGAIRIGTAEFRIGNADPERGDIVLNVASLDTSSLVVRGEYRRAGDSLTVALDTIRFDYKDVRWSNRAQVLVHDTREGQRLDSLVLRSNEGGLLSASANIPYSGTLAGNLTLDRFPVGELYAFAMATKPFSGLVSGDAMMEGTRDAPLFEWQLRADSLGVSGFYLPQVTSDGAYRDRRLVARAMLIDTLGGSLSAEARVPMDLSFRTVERRLLSDSVDADIIATQLQLGALGVQYTGVDRINGMLDGRMQLAGTIDRPFARGEMAIDGFSARVVELGLTPTEGRLALRASQDSLILERFRFRSGRAADTVSATGAVRFARGETTSMRMQLHARNALLAAMRDGTRVIASADLTAVGPVRRPTLSGRVVIPDATIVADPLGASTALDLNSSAARELLGTDEVPVAETAAQSFARLGRFVNVQNARIDFGDDVWVNTPEARVRVTGGLGIVTLGETIAPEGEINASRGSYRLNLGVVQRSFSIDSGSVRFFGNPSIPATLDISATNVVRSTGSSQIPVRVHIGGTLDLPVLTLSSPDPLYSGAPDSEIISLLIFGAPTFALDGGSQSTVRAVAGVLVPTAGGLLEGTLQRLLPFQFNTLQIQAPGAGQDDLSALSLVDNLSIAAGKQLSDRTFLRLNTGVCRGNGAAASAGVSLWLGAAVEYLLATRLTLQVGVDPGASPCSRLSGDVMPRMQFGFDLFRDWVF